MSYLHLGDVDLQDKLKKVAVSYAFEDSIDSIEELDGGIVLVTLEKDQVVEAEKSEEGKSKELGCYDEEDAEVKADLIESSLFPVVEEGTRKYPEKNLFYDSSSSLPEMLRSPDITMDISYVEEKSQSNDDTSTFIVKETVDFNIEDISIKEFVIPQECQPSQNQAENQTNSELNPSSESNTLVSQIPEHETLDSSSSKTKTTFSLLAIDSQTSSDNYQDPWKEFSTGTFLENYTVEPETIHTPVKLLEQKKSTSSKSLASTSSVFKLNGDIENSSISSEDRRKNIQHLISAKETSKAKTHRAQGEQVFNQSSAINVETNGDIAEESPSKEDLKATIQKLLREKEQSKANSLNHSFIAPSSSQTTDNKNIRWKCEVHNCETHFAKEVGYNTKDGLQKHYSAIHSSENLIFTKDKCPHCGKLVVFLKDHIRAVHKTKDLSRICPVCNLFIKSNMKQHSGICKKCPFCSYSNKKKKELLNHIDKKHPGLRSVKNEGYQEQPIDYSPNKDKFADMNLSSSVKVVYQVNENDMLVNNIESAVDDESEGVILCTSNFQNNEPEEPLNQKRKRYPFDKLNSLEGYTSEYEEDDELDFTVKRRKFKDELELHLRQVSDQKEGIKKEDKKFLDLFMKFEETKRGNKVSTCKMYTSAVRRYVLPAFHRLFNNFHAQMILDPKTEKNILFKGQPRSVPSIKPVFLSRSVVEEALKEIESYGGQSGSERGNLLAAIEDLMEFIESSFDKSMDLYGPQHLEEVITYHKAVKTFIGARNFWNTSNKEKTIASEIKKTIQSYNDPTRMQDLLKSYKKYLKSEDYKITINKIFDYVRNGEQLTPAMFNEAGHIVGSLIIQSTGCRPVVVRRMPYSSYVDKRPGWNPRAVSDGDCIVEFESEEEKIFRRVDPNQPPPGMGCEHQRCSKSAQCPFKCEASCDPDGWNISVTWDKTSGTKGPSQCHLVRLVKFVCDGYAILRVRQFPDENSVWLNEAPFLLTSSGKEFDFISLENMSKAMGMNITAYDFRRLVCTWAVSNPDPEIVQAEEEALQHTLKIARINYQQNTSIKPQLLTQTYAKEEELFPKIVQDTIEEFESSLNKEVKEMEDKSTKYRMEKVNKEKENYKKARKLNRPLGPKNRIREEDKDRFQETVEEITGESLLTYMSNLKPALWRKKIVRLVTTTEGSTGEELREVWIRIYEGDLEYGVRDERFKSLKEDKQKKMGNDRNSWIASAIKTKFTADLKKFNKIL